MRLMLPGKVIISINFRMTLTAVTLPDFPLGRGKYGVRFSRKYGIYQDHGLSRKFKNHKAILSIKERKQ